MNKLFSRGTRDGELVKSKLFNQDSFYKAFGTDLTNTKKNIVIESPYLTVKRINQLLPTINKLLKKGVRVIVNTKSPIEHDDYLRNQAETCITLLQNSGVTVLLTGNHHRKLAIIDDVITWEGSLNILSQNDSCEIMRRIESYELCQQMINFTGMRKWL